MPYCPTCKKEYPLGTTICVDCNISLIDNKAADMVSLVSLNNKEQAERFVAYMKEQNIECTYEYGVREDNYRIFVDKKDKKGAMKGFITFQSAEKRNRNGGAADPAPVAKPAVSDVKKAIIDADPEPVSAPSAASNVSDNTAKAKAAAPSSEPGILTEEATYESSSYYDEPLYEDSSSHVEPAYVEESPVVTEENPVAVSVEAPEESAPEEPVAAEADESVEETVAAEAFDNSPAADESAADDSNSEDTFVSEEEAEAAPNEDDDDDEEDDIEDDVESDVDDEDEDDEDDEENEEPEAPVFTANAATRTKLPVRPAVSKEEVPATSEDMFAARKTPKKRPSLFEEMEKDEAAAESAADSAISFTPKRPLTAYQFEKKRQEDLESYARNHGEMVLDSREPEAIAAADEVENAAGNGAMNFAFSNFEQQYVVPDYNETVSDPTPVYANSAGSSIDWGAGAEDIEVELESDKEKTAAQEVAEKTSVVSEETTQEEAAEPVVSEPVVSVEEEVDEEPAEPIFVETERVEHEEIDDSRIIDEADIRSYRETAEEASEPAAEDAPYVSPVTSADDPIDYGEPITGAEGSSNDAFSDFLNNFKKATLSKTRKKNETAPADPSNTIASVSRKAVAVPEAAKAVQKKPAVADAKTSEPSPAPAPAKPVKAPEAETAHDNIIAETLFEDIPVTADTVVEEIVPDAKYQNEEAADFEAVPSRPTDIQDTKIKVSLDSDIIEEVISDSTQESHPDIETSSSFANEERPADAAFGKEKPAPKPLDIDVDFDPDGTYRGFVPDYSPTDLSDSNEPEETSEYDEFKKKVHSRKEENAAINAQIKKEQVRQASLVKDFGKNGKIVFEDTEDLDNYAGFVPDYTPNTTNEEEFDFYKPHQVSSYAKYKKNKKGEDTPGVLSFMRLTGEEEADNLFVSHVPASAKREIGAADLKNATFLVCMGSKRLAKLFNSWMMLNITQQTVRAFESENCTEAQNHERKIAGIKKLLTDNFGELNEVFLEALVQRYYSKFLDE